MIRYPNVSIKGVKFRSTLAWVFSFLLMFLMGDFWLRPTILSLIHRDILQLTLILFILSWLRLCIVLVIFLSFVWFAYTLIPVLHKFGLGKSTRIEFKGEPLYLERKGKSVLQLHFVVGSSLFDSLSGLKKVRFIRDTFPSRLRSLKEGSVVYAETIESETLMLSMGFTRVSSKVSPIVGILCLTQTFFSYLADPSCTNPFKRLKLKLSRGNRWPKRYIYQG